MEALVAQFRARLARSVNGHFDRLGHGGHLHRNRGNADGEHETLAWCAGKGRGNGCWLTVNSVKNGMGWGWWWHISSSVKYVKYRAMHVEYGEHSLSLFRVYTLAQDCAKDAI